MSLYYFLVFGAVFFAFSLISKRIDNTVLTPPFLFTLTGLILGLTFLSDIEMSVSETAIHTITEITLVIVLATDAAGISLRSLYQYRAIPIRLLLVGLPLTIVLGSLVGLWLLPVDMWFEAALIAAILAPTDAALGASVVANKSVPLNIRQSLNVESGLNDGVALPAVLFFACFANLSHQVNDVNWINFLALQLILGPIVGVAVGWLGGQAIDYAARNDWIKLTFQGVAAIMISILAFAIAESIGGNGFIAAFVCGLTYGNLNVKYSNFLHEFTETESELLSQFTFFVFGLVILPHALSVVTMNMILYAMLSLTVIRMVPVTLSMFGSGLRWQSVGFMGWFGPRGLASLLFGLLVLEDLSVKNMDTVLTVVAITVCMSIVMHGVSAAPLSKVFGRWAGRVTGAQCPENKA